MFLYRWIQICPILGMSQTQTEAGLWPLKPSFPTCIFFIGALMSQWAGHVMCSGPHQVMHIYQPFPKLVPSKYDDYNSQTSYPASKLYSNLYGELLIRKKKDWASYILEIVSLHFWFENFCIKSWFRATVVSLKAAMGNDIWKIKRDEGVGRKIKRKGRKLKKKSTILSSLQFLPTDI